MGRAAQQRATPPERVAEAPSAAPPVDAADAEPRPPVDIRSLSLAIIAILAVTFALHWARTFCVSLLLGILIAYALNPVVLRMERIRVPRVIAATLVMLALAFAGVMAISTLGGQIRAVLEQLPEAAKKVSAKAASMRTGEPGTLEKVQTAAREIEKATNQATGAPISPKQITAVVVEPQGFRVSSFLWANSLAVASFAGHAVMVMFLAFFLLLSATRSSASWCALPGLR